MKVPMAHLSWSASASRIIHASFGLSSTSSRLPWEGVLHWQPTIYLKIPG